MKLKLTDLDPHFLKRASPVDYDHSDDIAAAVGLQLQCPACHWVNRRTHSDETAHTILLWRDAGLQFTGRSYDDLSLVSGKTLVNLTGGACLARFHVKDGRVDFS